MAVDQKERKAMTKELTDLEQEVLKVLREVELQLEAARLNVLPMVIEELKGEVRRTL